MRKPRVDPIVPHIGARFKTVLQVDHVCSGQQVAECLANVLARGPQAARRHEVIFDDDDGLICCGCFLDTPDVRERVCYLSFLPNIVRVGKRLGLQPTKERRRKHVIGDHLLRDVRPRNDMGKADVCKANALKHSSSVLSSCITAGEAHHRISHILLHAASHGPPPLGAPREVPSWWASQS